MAAEVVANSDKHKTKKSSKLSDDDEEKKKVFVPRSAQDLQRLQLERLMKDPDKLVEIPESKREWKPRSAPDFVRHVMGSSAGAGSGEFHVYRGIRRRETNRMAYIEEKAAEEDTLANLCLIDDLLKYAEDENIDAIMFVADIKKAFDLLEANEAYNAKLEANRSKDEERTAKRRAKRQKKKQKKLQAKKQKKDSEKDKDENAECGSDEPRQASDYEDESEEPHFVIGGK